jgi:putative tricarboxylic transport membrane protein
VTEQAERTTQVELLEQARPARAGWAPTVALVVVLSAFTAYTVEAFQLEWLTARGNIGAGRFPRVIGIAGMVATALALILVSRRRRKDQRPVEGEHVHRTHWAALVAVVSSVLLVALLEVLGALVAGFLFLLVNLHVLNRGRHLLNVVVAAGFVAAVYGLMSVLLAAPWAVGLLGF